MIHPPPGSTPAAVALTGVWSEDDLAAVLTWTMSTHPDLDHFSVRSSPGPTYKTADEFVVALVPKTETTFTTDSGLGAPGARALYRVYVVLTTANERGSNTVSVTRPG